MYSDRFDILCERYYQEILNFVKRKIGSANYQDAYDVTNKTFLKLTERKHVILNLNDLATKSFIYSTAMNCCMQYFRESRKKNYETELNYEIEIPMETMEEENAKNILEIIQANLYKLTEKEQVLFMEYWLNNRKLSEIAEEIHITYDSTKQMNSKLRNKLSKLVQEELND